jgi:protein tyrosine phosphatase
MFKSGRSTKNSKKNKYSKVLPSNKLVSHFLDEKTRVKLQTSEKHQEDYINANIIDLEGVKQKYIATQAPFSETFVDFWRMILEFRIKIIVMLTETDEDSPDEAFLGKVSFSFEFNKKKSKADRYWPLLGESKVFGNVQVETISQELIRDVNQFEFLVTDLQKNNKRKVYLYQYLGWPDMGTPKSTKSLNFIMKQISKKEEENLSPVVVHCR